MDIRCGSCSKLFRVADEKIAGKGIRFKCSRCGETVTVTRDDFEQDKAAREGAVPSFPVQEPTPPSPSPPAEEQPAQEYQPQEYKPPTVPAGMDDFDFSEPHAAATANQEDSDSGGAFSFGDLGGLGGEVDQKENQEDSGEDAAGSEISLSESDAQEAEAAFQFPTDIISEPKPLPSSKSKPATEPPSASETIDLGDALTVPETSETGASLMAEPDLSVTPEATAPPAAEPIKDTEQEEELDLGAALAIPKAPAEEQPKPASPGPVFSPALFKKAAVAAQEEVSPQEDNFDLGSALSMPRTASEETTEPDSSGDVGEVADGEGIHPFASGNLTGAIAGLICAAPVLYFLTLGFDKLAESWPVLKVLPRWYLLTVSGTGILALGVVIGIFTAFVQAQTGRRFLFLVNILLGTLFGTAIGAVLSIIVSLAGGGGFNLTQLQADATLWAGASFLISSVLALARGIFTRTREETFAVGLTIAEKVGFGLSGVVLLAALYGVGTFAGQMEHADQALAKQRQETMKKQATVISPEGLTVVNGMAYLDPSTGDLVMSGAVQSVLDRPKEGWYLQADVLDANQKVLATVLILNGVQLFSPRDREVLTKRSINIDALREQMVRESSSTIPAHGSVPFTCRWYDPQKEAASFLPRLKRFEMPVKTEKKP